MQLAARSVRHAFAGRLVLNDVSLTVQSGESLAIVGPSGMGKTTLLAVLGGLLRPDSGEVNVTGRNGATPARGDIRRWVSWVLQTTNVLSDRTVRDNVRLGCVAGGIRGREAEKRIVQCLEQVGLASRVDAPVRLLSGGETQRVVIARALAGDRPFLLADEPTGQLDSATSALVMDALRAATRNRALILVTHDADLAAQCQRRARLVDGQLLEGEGRPHE